MFSRRRAHSAYRVTKVLSVVSVAVLFTVVAYAQVSDPGPRGGDPGAGGPLPGLGNKEATSFNLGLDAFEEVVSVTGTIPGTEAGLGPRFNLNSCKGCHIHPA